MKIALIILAMLLSACTQKLNPTYNSKVVKISGCDKFGYCGVVLANGTILSDERFAEVGQVPMCYEFKTCHEVIK